MAKTFSVSISDDQAAFVRSRLKAGYNSVSEVFREALRALEQAETEAGIREFDHVMATQSNEAGPSARQMATIIRTQKEIRKELRARRRK